MGRVTRRHWLGFLGVGTLIGARAGCSDGLRASPDHQAESPVAGWPPYKTLNPRSVALAAYSAHIHGGCMYAVSLSIVNALSDAHGVPRTWFPHHMMRYGNRGIAGWGTLCGALNGGAAMIGLFEKDSARQDQLIGDLFSWYESTPLPTFTPGAGTLTHEIPRTAAGSVLCHLSVNQWCKTSGEKAFGPAKRERCRRLTADVAARVVELLNGSIRDSPSLDPLTPDVQSCLSCHGKTGSRDALVGMNCSSCHMLSQEHPDSDP